jgi:Flp pilus assembly protein TadG
VRAKELTFMHYFIEPRASIRPHRPGEEGAIAVEFIFLMPLFLLILAGIVEFGHLWYVRQAIAGASREGARSAVVYRTGSDAARQTWAISQASTAVNNYLKPPGNTRALIAATWTTTPTVTFNPDTGGLVGGTLRVQVRAGGFFLVLAELVPAFKNISVVAETTMKFE